MGKAGDYTCFFLLALIFGATIGNVFSFLLALSSVMITNGAQETIYGRSNWTQASFAYITSTLPTVLYIQLQCFRGIEVRSAATMQIPYLYYYGSGQLRKLPTEGIWEFWFWKDSWEHMVEGKLKRKQMWYSTSRWLGS